MLNRVHVNLYIRLTRWKFDCYGLGENAKHWEGNFHRTLILVNSFQALRLSKWPKLESWLSSDFQEESPRNSFLMSSFLAFLPQKLTPPECPGISPFLIFNILSLFLSQCSRMYHFVIATDLRSTLKMWGNTMITNKVMPKIITSRIIYWTQSRGYNALKLFFKSLANSSMFQVSRWLLLISEIFTFNCSKSWEISISFYIPCKWVFVFSQSVVVR